MLAEVKKAWDLLARSEAGIPNRYEHALDLRNGVGHD